MKKTLKKSIALGAVIFGLGTASVFANGNVRMRNPNLPHERNEFARGNTPNKKMPVKDERPNVKNDLLGTVSAVSAENKTISVKDADGKETQVHVNPLTRMNEIPSKAEREKMRAETLENRKNADKKLPNEGEKPHEMEMKNEIALSDVKVGDWVMVKKIGSGTKTLEAGRISVARE